VIKAIIFDCFGVLAESSYESYRDTYLLHDQSLIKRFHEVEQLSSSAKMSQEETMAEFARLAGVSVELTTKLLHTNPKNIELLAYIKQNLKATYRIGFLSNVGIDRMDELFSPEDIALFDDVILSFQVGIAKPEAEVFELAATRLSVEPQECIFVDDRSDYCRGAEKIGMKTIVYTDFERFRKEIEGILND
jgi:epoxide hydrolase-like predicted phosphatase